MSTDGAGEGALTEWFLGRVLALRAGAGAGLGTPPDLEKEGVRLLGLGGSWPLLWSSFCSSLSACMQQSLDTAYPA